MEVTGHLHAPAVYPLDVTPLLIGKQVSWAPEPVWIFCTE